MTTLDDTPPPMDPMLVKAIETAFLAFSVPTVEFMPVPRAWRDANPDGASKGPGGPAKARIKLDLIQRDGFRCAYCAREFVDLNDATLDHVIPNCVVGHWETWNLVLACDPCNNAKGDSAPLVLVPMLAHLLVQLAASNQHRTTKKAKRQKAPFVGTPPIPTNGFPSRGAYQRAQKEAYLTAWARKQVDQALAAMQAPPIRPALESAPVRAALPAGQDGA